MSRRPAVEHPGEVRWETRLLVVVAATLTVFGIAERLSAASFQRPHAFREVLKQLVGAGIGGIA